MKTFFFLSCSKNKFLKVSDLRLHFEIFDIPDYFFSNARIRRLYARRGRAKICGVFQSIFARRAYCSQGLQKSMCVRPDRPTVRPSDRDLFSETVLEQEKE